MPRTSFFLLLGAIVFAVVAVLIARVYMTRPQTPVVTAQPAPVATVGVVVAAAQLNFGDKIAADRLRVAQFPPASVPPGSFPTIAAAVGTNDRAAIRTVEANEPLLAKSVSGKGSRLSAAGLIGTSMRAVTLPVNDITGVAGFLASGDRVDVMLLRVRKSTVPPFLDDNTVDLLIPNVHVLAVGQDPDEAKSKPEVVRTATIEVTPLQAQKIALAQTAGTLTLALRGISDATQSPLRTVRMNDLHDGNFTAPDPVVRIRTRTTVRTIARPLGSEVEIVRAGKGEKYLVPAGG